MNTIKDKESKLDEIEVSTKTIIASTNIQIDLDKFYKYMPITQYIPIEKKRGRKKKSVVEQEPQQLAEGSIITLQKGNEFRGVIVKKKRIGAATFFLHSVSVVMSIENNKFINVKTTTNGTFQITGCKNNEQCYKTVRLLYQHIKNVECIIKDKIIMYPEGVNSIKIVFNTVMQNMDYNIGFDISREKLNTFINNKTNFTSIYEGSIGTGVNIKIENRYPFEEYLTVMKIDYQAETMQEKIEFDKIIDKDFIQNELEYDEFYDENDYEYSDSDLKAIKKIKEELKNEEENSKKKKVKKEKYHTFLVFASGSIIMSSRGPIMKDIFKELVEMLVEHKTEIREQIIA